MIYAIVGRPRSGKSYESVAFHIIPAVKKGRKVITNVSLNMDFFVKVFGEQVRELIVIVDGKLNEYGRLDRPFSQFEHYSDEWRDENGVGPLYVVDEAHMVLPNRQLDSKILEFYSLHGHYGIDIILLTQNLRKIHRDIKDMIELTYYCAKLTSIGSDKSYNKEVRVGATKEVVNSELRKYRKDIFPFYKSHTQSSKAVLEQSANDVVPLWKRWPVIGAVLLTILGIGLNVWIWTGDDEQLPEEQPQTQNVQQPKTSEPETQPSLDPQIVSNNKFGPLGHLEMTVSGYSKQIAYSSRNTRTAEIDRDLTFYRIYIDVYDGKKKMFSLNQTDLQAIGYTFRVLAECVYQLDWVGKSKILTCKDSVEESEEPSVMDKIPSFT